MIIARSFARIHETNLKVRIEFSTILYTTPMREPFTEAGCFALVVRRQE